MDVLVRRHECFLLQFRPTLFWGARRDNKALIFAFSDWCGIPIGQLAGARTLNVFLSMIG